PARGTRPGGHAPMARPAVADRPAPTKGRAPPDHAQQFRKYVRFSFVAAASSGAGQPPHAAGPARARVSDRPARETAATAFIGSFHASRHSPLFRFSLGDIPWLQAIRSAAFSPSP